jgi:LacI family transcriptional regulator
LLIASTESDPTVETAPIERLLEQRVEGLTYAATWHRAVELPEIAREVPTVLVNCFDAEGRYPAVLPDERTGGRRATERLLAAEHRRIGFINLDPEIPAAVGRRVGYREVLQEAGSTQHDELGISGHATADGGCDAASALLYLTDPPTAIFCANDRMATGAYDAIQERGLRIPDDVAVVGFDNAELISAYLRPGPTTVALPFEQTGAQGVELLADIIAGANNRRQARNHPRPAHRKRIGLTRAPVRRRKKGTTPS